MPSFRFFLALWLTATALAAQAPSHLADSEAATLAGPWETASPSAIDGVFLELSTGSSNSLGSEEIERQPVGIRVYHRESGKETWGWFSVPALAKPGLFARTEALQPPHTFSLFDGRRLRIHSIDADQLHPFDLDLYFDFANRRWTGTWSCDGQSREVTLQRPRPAPASAVNVFVGNWIGTPDGRLVSASGTLHICQSADGDLTAWLDVVDSATDARTGSTNFNSRYGGLLRILSSSGSTLALETTNVTGAVHQYRAALSNDRRTLTGEWSQTGGRLNVPTAFRRAPSLPRPVARANGVSTSP